MTSIKQRLEEFDKEIEVFDLRKKGNTGEKLIRGVEGLKHIPILKAEKKGFQEGVNVTIDEVWGIVDKFQEHLISYCVLNKIIYPNVLMNELKQKIEELKGK